MKTFKLLAAGALIIFTLPAYSQIYTYSYSGPANGSIQLALAPGGGYGGTGSGFSTLDETFTINLTAQTVETSGTITLSGTGGAFSMSDLSMQNVGSGTLTVLNNGVVSFDSTSSFSSYNGTSGYADSGFMIPVSATGLYQGQSFSGSWNVGCPIVTDFSDITPTSMVFSQYTGDNETLYYYDGGVVVPQFGLYDGGSGETDYAFDWDQQNLVAVANPSAVPEPDSLALFGLGASALTFWFRRRKK